MFSSCYSKNIVFLHLKVVFFLRVQIDCIMAFYFCIQIEQLDL